MSVAVFGVPEILMGRLTGRKQKRPERGVVA